MTETPVGLDVGFGQTKACACNGAGVFAEVMFPSMTVRVTDDVLDEDFVQPSFMDETGKYMVGDDALELGNPRITSPDSSYFVSDEFRVLALYALRRLGIQEAAVVTGLPVQHFKTMKDKVQEFLLRIGRDNGGIKIRAVRIVPQPFGSVLDFGWDWKGQRISEVADRRIGVIDIGRGSVDVMEVSRLRPVIGRSEGLMDGIHTVHRQVYETIRSSAKYKSAKVTMAQMDRFVREGGFHIGPNWVSLERIIRDAKRAFARRIATLIDDVWGGISQLDTVIVTGGGAELIRDELQGLIPEGQLHVPRDAAKANARGFAKMAAASRNA